MNRIKRAFIFTIIVFSIPVFLIYSIPKYPVINNSLPKEAVSKLIEENLKYNTKKFSFENMDNRIKIQEYNKNLLSTAKIFDECTTKECLIDEYNNFMSEWVAMEIKAKHRYINLAREYGVIGNVLNQFLIPYYALLP